MKLKQNKNKIKISCIIGLSLLIFITLLYRTIKTPIIEGNEVILKPPVEDASSSNANGSKAAIERQKQKDKEQNELSKL